MLAIALLARHLLNGQPTCFATPHAHSSRFQLRHELLSLTSRDAELVSRPQLSHKALGGLCHGCLLQHQQPPVPHSEIVLCKIGRKAAVVAGPGLAMECGHPAESSHATPSISRDELISPRPLDSPEEADSSDVSGLSSNSRTSHDDGSVRAKTANAIFRLPPEVIERYPPPYTRDLQT